MGATPRAPRVASRSMSEDGKIDLESELTLRHAFWFPLQSPIARKEVIQGGLLLLIPVVGWLLNMGHRIVMTHSMQHGQEAWPAWRDYPTLLRHGFFTFLGMVEYHLPAIALSAAGYWWEMPALHVCAGIAGLLATMAVPGYMSHYCFTLDPREIFNPFRALRRALESGTRYWRAWLIALAALFVSFAGLLALGVGFLFTSVWFWQVAGYSFANAMSRHFQLGSPRAKSFF